ncbi:MAG: hypothetical protein FIB08_09130 [Candidatus Methanoperedens sp.]|nr:hypothetical protein [Candidatus Methanoperedens sp.]
MKHKTKGTEIRKLGKYYYLYKIRSEYDKEKKRANKSFFAFFTFKNVLNADRSYMRDDSAMEGWMFVNFIALLLYYKVYGLLLLKN